MMGIATHSEVSQDAPLDIVVFGSFDRRRHPRVEVLREGLVDLGHRVQEVNRPLGVSTADKVRAASSPVAAIAVAGRIARSWVGLVRAGLAGDRTPDVVLVGYLGHFDVHLARLLWPRSTVVLDHLVGLADTSLDRGVASGAKLRLLERLDRSALSAADVIVVDTEEQRSMLPPSARTRSVVVPVGATREWFAQPAPAPPPPVRVCFVGLYTPLHGAPVIGAAIRLLAEDPRFRFTMVGSGQELEATRREVGPVDVEWIDWVDDDQLPGFVASQHVSLGIFGTTPKAHRVVPNKVYQGVAAGTVVITSDTEPQRRALGDAVEYVPPGDPERLAARLSDVADHLLSGERQAPTTASPGDFAPRELAAGLVDSLARTDTRRSDLVAGPALTPAAWLRFDLVRPVLEALPRSRVLEIGPGRGAVAARLAGSGHDYTAVEMSEESRRWTRELLLAQGHNDAMVHPDLAPLEGAAPFDVLCAFEVLEHIDDDGDALQEWVALLQPGGMVLLSVPAWPERFSVTDERVGHLRRYTPESLRQLVEGVGLRIDSLRLYGFPLGYALESARNVLASRQVGAGDGDTGPGDTQLIERTKESGAWFQPPASADTVTRLVTWPFRRLQRLAPQWGTGLVVVARLPQ